MLICAEHLTRLRAEVRRKGLSHTFAASVAAPYDALAGARLAITAEFVRERGLKASFADICPLCEIDREDPGRGAEWIGLAVGDQALKSEPFELNTLH